MARAPSPRRRRLSLGLAALGSGAAAVGGCAGLPEPSATPTDPATPDPPSAGSLPPPAPREFRAAWVASVANIDWPSRPGLPAAQQRAEALAMLDRASQIGLNALVLQVRPAADALYPSALEPWSEVLGGIQGQPPDDGYDPLAFWVDQAHRRGLELHAWFNPFRARHPSARSPLAVGHVARTRPQLVRAYGDQLWLDPAEPAAAELTLAVVADVLARYDIDGVHIDDYFYPYPVKPAGGGDELPFPDDAPWQRYRAAGGTAARDDWRRAQVDRLVQALHRLVRSARPGLRLGISPFGLMHPDLRPPGIQGFSQFHRLYADVERWLREGWLDYLAPQLYWPIARSAQAFAPLLDGWLRLNTAGRELWPGLFTSAVGAPNRPWPAQEILDQVALLRQRPGVGGHLHFSLSALLQDRDGIATRLRAGPYAQAALVPPRPAWLDPAARPPEAPQWAVEAGGDGPALRLLQPPAAAQFPVFIWAVWRRIAGQWRFDSQPAGQRLLATRGADALVVGAVGRSGHESRRVAWFAAPASDGRR